MVKQETKGKAILKKNPPKGKTSSAEPKPGPFIPDKKSRYTHRRSSREKGRENIGIEDAPAESTGAALEDNWDVSQFKIPPAEGKTRFHDFDLPNPLLHAICDLGFEYCTPIQAEILPSSLSGKDASGKAQTGTGKTAAFLITVITRILYNPIQGKRKP
ncbi:MAG: DEAD/DEAH box helicase, partial [Pseudomonadota bacterium]